MHCTQPPAELPWSTLPPASYCSDGVYDVEVERIWRANWVNVGHESMVASPGDHRCVDVAGEPLVVTRDQGGEVHALSRVCAHRWMEVCTGAGSTRTLQWPYHHWTYSLSGELKAAPLMSETPAFAKDQCGLQEFQSATWHGFIYVNLDGTGARLRGRIARNDAIVRAIHEEDSAICAAVQRGATAASAVPGPLSTKEQHNRTFAAWYTAAMTGASTSPSPPGPARTDGKQEQR